MSTPRAPRPRNSAVAKAANAGNGSKNVWVIVAIVAVVAFAAVIAVALSQESGGNSDETADVEVAGEGLPLQQVAPEGAIGATAPELSGTGLDGEPISIENDGRPKLIGFFAHWCPHCQAEVPVIVDWLDAGGKPDDVDFYGVSTSVDRTRPNYPPSNWFEDEGWSSPTLIDSSASAAHMAFGAGNFPYWVVVDADGKVVNATSGELGADALTALAEQARGGGGAAPDPGADTDSSPAPDADTDTDGDAEPDAE
ncbi:MAG: TlpA family protein disulfide reductase [Acidimicrobiia bacterium]|nr:TlpA family protein disulfide reductase [Acidimicrobiia bacterium]